MLTKEQSKSKLQQTMIKIPGLYDEHKQYTSNNCASLPSISNNFIQRYSSKQYIIPEFLQRDINFVQRELQLHVDKLAEYLVSENKAESAAGQMQKIFTHTARVMEFIGSKLTRTMKLNQDSLNRQSYLNQLSQLSIHEMCQNCYKNKYAYYIRMMHSDLLRQYQLYSYVHPQYREDEMVACHIDVLSEGIIHHTIKHLYASGNQKRYDIQVCLEEIERFKDGMMLVSKEAEVNRPCNEKEFNIRKHIYEMGKDLHATLIQIEKKLRGLKMEGLAKDTVQKEDVEVQTEESKGNNQQGNLKLISKLNEYKGKLVISQKALTNKLEEYLRRNEELCNNLSVMILKVEQITEAKHQIYLQSTLSRRQLFNINITLEARIKQLEMHRRYRLSSCESGDSIDEMRRSDSDREKDSDKNKLGDRINCIEEAEAMEYDDGESNGSVLDGDSNETNYDENNSKISPRFASARTNLSLIIKSGVRSSMASTLKPRFFESYKKDYKDKSDCAEIALQTQRPNLTLVRCLSTSYNPSSTHESNRPRKSTLYAHRNSRSSLLGLSKKEDYREHGTDFPAISQIESAKLKQSLQGLPLKSVPKEIEQMANLHDSQYAFGPSKLHKTIQTMTNSPLLSPNSYINPIPDNKRHFRQRSVRMGQMKYQHSKTKSQENLVENVGYGGDYYLKYRISQLCEELFTADAQSALLMKVSYVNHGIKGKQSIQKISKSYIASLVYKSHEYAQHKIGQAGRGYFKHKMLASKIGQKIPLGDSMMTLGEIGYSTHFYSCMAQLHAKAPDSYAYVKRFISSQPNRESIAEIIYAEGDDNENLRKSIQTILLHHRRCEIKPNQNGMCSHLAQFQANIVRLLAE